MRNNHFINCVWSNDILGKTQSDYDFYCCFYGERFIKNLCSEIVDLIGLEYIINFKK